MPTDREYLASVSQGLQPSKNPLAFQIAQVDTLLQYILILDPIDLLFHNALYIHKHNCPVYFCKFLFLIDMLCF